MSVTIRDVAKTAGVSLKTVSRVLNNEPRVRTETRERVSRAITKLDYHPNPLARSLATKQTRTIGLVVPTVSNSFFASGIEGCSAIADQHGYNLVLTSTGIDPIDPPHERRHVHALLTQRVSGMIVWAGSLSSSVVGEMMERMQHICPIVFIDHPADSNESTRIPHRSILVPQEYVGALATEHLLNEGRRRIAHISVKGGWPVEQRLSGYKKALVSHGVTVEDQWIRQARQATIREGVIVASTLLSRHPYPDSIFAYNDLLAVGALLACRRAHRRVPDDIAVVGVDDTDMAAVTSPPLTTIRLHQYHTGQHAMELLVTLIEGDAPSPFPSLASSDLLVPDLIVRRSSTLGSLSMPLFDDIDDL